ncbi:hypothetical protein [Paenibacillus paeoniae]|uniref:hypothetical protein n=1 Tax=Paenibacillus paeoniae TaxID=2292705 RepID=UPI001F0B9132|nr:hypothetical protein [Paenibacillus paeoniae]
MEPDSNDFKASLDIQYDMLLQKQQHIQRVLATVERVRAIVKDNGTIDSQLILLMIHSIQHEGELKQLLSGRLPDAFIQSLFLSELSSEEQIQVEHETTLVMYDLFAMFKQGLPPEDPIVQERALSLKLIFDQRLGQPLEELGMSETGRTFAELDLGFQNIFEPNFKNYLFEVLRRLILRENG